MATRFCISGEFAGYRLKKPLPLEIHQDKDGHICLQNEELELYSCGETFREALEHLEVVFRTAIEEYLLSDESMSEGAKRLKGRFGCFVEVNWDALRLCD